MPKCVKRTAGHRRLNNKPPTALEWSGALQPWEPHASLQDEEAKMTATTVERVPRQTSTEVNRRIRQQTEERIRLLRHQSRWN